jgi:hypothetical protein
LLPEGASGQQYEPAHLSSLLRERHEVHHAAHLGWAALDNGKLLKEASAAGFQVMITADKSIPDE